MCAFGVFLFCFTFGLSYSNLDHGFISVLQHVCHVSFAHLISLELILIFLFFFQKATGFYKGIVPTNGITYLI